MVPVHLRRCWHLVNGLVPMLRRGLGKEAATFHTRESWLGTETLGRHFLTSAQAALIINQGMRTPTPLLWKALTRVTVFLWIRPPSLMISTTGAITTAPRQLITR